MGTTMRSVLMSAVLLGSVGLYGCASSAPVVEKDAGYDFGAVSSYAWVTDEPVLITFGKDQPNVRTKENEMRVRAAIERELEARGMEKVDPEAAQVMVAFSVGTRMRYRLEGGDRTSNFTEGPGAKQTEGTLNIYLLDRETDKEVWHGSTSKWLKKTDDPDAIVNEAVGKIMAQFP
ncbi:MAG: DUF4136 domain-containing protein [Nannocystaceae bacterium]|nr:DUF4136 domain-containing protein [bacterium]